MVTANSFDYDAPMDGTPPKRVYQLIVTVTDSLDDDGSNRRRQ